MPSLVMVALGFSAALPYFLIFDTLSAWLRASGLSLEVIGFFSLVTIINPPSALPLELQDANPRRLWRSVDGEMTRDGSLHG